jgi:hypothetical protein
MKRIIPLLALAACSLAQAAPYVVWSVPAEVDTCVYTPQGLPTVEFPVVVDAVRGKPATNNRVCEFDVANAPVGTNNITAANKSALWGVTSSATPFAFTRPGPASQPSAIQLAP